LQKRKLYKQGKINEVKEEDKMYDSRTIRRAKTLVTMLAGTLALAVASTYVENKREAERQSPLVKLEAKQAAELERLAGGPVYDIPVPEGFRVEQWWDGEGYPGSLKTANEIYSRLNPNPFPQPGDYIRLVDIKRDNIVAGVKVDPKNALVNPKQYQTN
jgi:hypothetical protein